MYIYISLGSVCIFLWVGCSGYKRVTTYLYCTSLGRIVKCHKMWHEVSGQKHPIFTWRDLGFTVTACFNYHMIKQTKAFGQPTFKRVKMVTKRAHEDVSWPLRAKETFSTFLETNNLFSLDVAYSQSPKVFHIQAQFFTLWRLLRSDGDLSRCNKKGGWEKAGGFTYSWKFKLELTVVTKRNTGL